ncbi:MAG: response regulator [Cellvibrionaceae bacterium]
MKILIVEDEKELAEILKSYLEKDSYIVEIEPDGLHASDKILKGNFDLVLLDLMLPHKDGLEICNEVRQSSNIPIIIMTAKVEEVDRLIGLKLGADDYICKPYSPREVVARVDAVLRRSSTLRNNNDTTNDISNTDSKLTIDTESLTANFAKRSIVLTLVEFNILKTLLSRPGRIFSRNELMDSAYNDHRIVNDRTIDSHITKLRKKVIGITDEETIRSVYGAGYKYDGV